MSSILETQPTIKRKPSASTLSELKAINLRKENEELEREIEKAKEALNQ